MLAAMLQLRLHLHVPLYRSSLGLEPLWLKEVHLPVVQHAITRMLIFLRSRTLSDWERSTGDKDHKDCLKLRIIRLLPLYNLSAHLHTSDSFWKPKVIVNWEYLILTLVR